MRHVDDHDVAEDVGVAEVMLESVQLCPRFLELSPTPRLSVVHHQTDLLQLLIQFRFCLCPLQLKFLDFFECIIETFTVCKFIAGEFFN